MFTKENILIGSDKLGKQLNIKSADLGAAAAAAQSIQWHKHTHTYFVSHTLKWVENKLIDRNDKKKKEFIDWKHRKKGSRFESIFQLL